MSMYDALVNDSDYAPVSSSENSDSKFDLGNLIKYKVSESGITPDSNNILRALSESVTLKTENRKRLEDLTRNFSDEVKSVSDKPRTVQEKIQEYLSKFNEVVSDEVNDATLRTFDKFRIKWQEKKDSGNSIEDVADSMYLALDPKNSSLSTSEEEESEITSRANSVMGVDSDRMATVSNTVESMGAQFSKGYSGEEISKNLLDPLIDVFSDATRSFIQNPINILERSSTFAAISNPSQFINGMASSVVSNLTQSMKDISDTLFQLPMESLDNIVNTFQDCVSSYANNAVNKFTDKIQDGITGLYDKTVKKLEDKAVNGIKDLFSQKGLWGDSSEDSRDVLRPIKPQENYLLNPRMKPIKRDSFKVNDEGSGTSMANDLYWDVEIVPHKYLEDSPAPPDLNEIFNCSGSRLPIVAYGLEAGGLFQSSFEIYPGVTLGIPLNYSRPSSFNISIVNLLVDKLSNKSGFPSSNKMSAYSCIDKFRDDFVEYVVGDATLSLGSLPACLDYHYCTYEITVTKFTQQWIPVKKWKLLGIPVINISDQGSSSSTQEIQSLSFSIVGQSDDTDLGLNVGSAFQAPTNKFNINRNMLSSAPLEIPSVG